MKYPKSKSKPDDGRIKVNIRATAKRYQNKLREMLVQAGIDRATMVGKPHTDDAVLHKDVTCIRYGWHCRVRNNHLFVSVRGQSPFKDWDMGIVEVTYGSETKRLWSNVWYIRSNHPRHVKKIVKEIMCRIQ